MQYALYIVKKTVHSFRIQIILKVHFSLMASYMVKVVCVYVHVCACVYGVCVKTQRIRRSRCFGSTCVSALNRVIGPMCIPFSMAEFKLILFVFHSLSNISI